MRGKSREPDPHQRIHGRVYGGRAPGRARQKAQAKSQTKSRGSPWARMRGQGKDPVQGACIATRMHLVRDSCHVLHECWNCKDQEGERRTERDSGGNRTRGAASGPRRQRAGWPSHRKDGTRRCPRPTPGRARRGRMQAKRESPTCGGRNGGGPPPAGLRRARPRGQLAPPGNAVLKPRGAPRACAQARECASTPTRAALHGQRHERRLRARGAHRRALHRDHRADAPH